MQNASYAEIELMKVCILKKLEQSKCINPFRVFPVATVTVNRKKTKT